MSDLKRIMALFWPVFVEQVLAVAVGVISTAMVSGLSGHAVAGVGLVSGLNLVVTNLFLAVSTGTTVIAAQCAGRRDIGTARKVSRQSLALVTYVGAALAALLLLFERPLLNALFGGAEPEVLAAARVYLRFSSVSMPFLAVSSTVGGIMRAVGEVRLPMLGGVASNAVNVGVTALAVYGLHAGVAGAGWGLLASRAVPAALMLVLLQWGHSPLSRLRLGPKVTLDAVRPVLGIAIPAGLDSLIFNGCKLLVQVFMANMGTDTLAANAVLANVSAFVTLPGTAVGVLAVSVTGAVFGAGDRAGARKSALRLTLLGSALNLLSAAVVFALLRPTIGLFSPTDAAYKLIYDCMILFILACPPLWSFSFVLPCSLRAMDMARYTMVVSAASMVVLRLFCAWLLGVYLGYGLYGVWIAMFLDWVGRGVFFMVKITPRPFSSPT